MIELTADDTSKTKILINADHIVSVAAEPFTGVTKLMVPGMMFAVKETYDEIKALITPN